MKVTAILPDELVEEVRRRAQGKTLTESLIRALDEWRHLKAVQELNREVGNRPLEFQEGASAEALRELNRR